MGVYGQNDSYESALAAFYLRTTWGESVTGVNIYNFGIEGKDT